MNQSLINEIYQNYNNQDDNRYQSYDNNDNYNINDYIRVNNEQKNNMKEKIVLLRRRTSR